MAEAINATGEGIGREPGTAPTPSRGRRPSETRADAGRSGRRIQSVDRALDVLEALARSGSELALNEIAREVGLNVSTTHHIVATLVGRGYVGQNPKGRTYFLGTRLLELASSRVKQFNLVDVAMPELARLNRETRESVHLATLQGHDLVTLAQLDSLETIRVGASARGKTNAAHATATGKAILAWLPETEIARVIAEKGLTRFTERTTVSIAALMEDLRHVRRNGFAVDDEEFELGVYCIGAAIRDHTGAVIGSISCSVPKIRATADYIERVRGPVRDVAMRLSERIGGPRSAPGAGDSVAADMPADRGN